MQKRSTLWLSFILLLCSILGCAAPHKKTVQEEIPKARAGKIDLSTIDLSDSRLIALDGEWNFYWSKLLLPSETRTKKNSPEVLHVPGEWSLVDTLSDTKRTTHGYATYHLKVIAPNSDEKLGIQINYLPTAARIYIDDTLIAQNGQVATTKPQSKFEVRPIAVELPNVSDTFAITIQLSNYHTHKSGILHGVALGKASDIMSTVRRLHFYTLVFFGGSLFLGLFFIMTFVVNPKKRALFFFGLFLISFSYWKVATGKSLNYFFPGHDMLMASRLEFAACFLFVYAAISFSIIMYPKESIKSFVSSFQYFELTLAILALVLPLQYVTLIIDYHLYCITLMLCYFGLVVSKAIYNRHEDVVFVFIGIGVGVINLFAYIFRSHSVWGISEVTFFTLNILLTAVLASIVIHRQFSNYSRMSKEAIAGTQARSQFLSVISHEMRTPMNGIIGMTELLSNTPLNKEQQSYLESIQTSGTSLITLIDDILDVTRIQKGKLRIEHETFDIHILFQQVHRLFLKNAEQRGLALQLTISPEVPKYVVGDIMRFKQVLDNLINNALKFTKEGSVHIYLSARAIEDNQVQMTCQIRDTGIGIPEHQQQEIFDPFLQADSSRSRRHMGLGLGLPICKRLIKLMDGTIEVQSEVGKGSTFSFTLCLPKGNPPALKNPPKSLPTSPISGTDSLRILVAEDNPINLKLLLAALKRFGHKADSVCNGKEALRASRAKTYDLILMDLQMPEMDGIESTRYILEDHIGRKRPYIVACTANSFPEDRQAALDTGMDDYLLKPIQLSTLKALLEEVAAKAVC
ncbi:MAG: ATP-binding protein [Bacteroidota bacterium]